MRLHVVSLPHTSTTEAYSWCAFTEKCRRFATMMSSLGDQVYLYGGPQNEATCFEHIDCTSGFYFDERIPPFDAAHPGWLNFNDNVIVALGNRKLADDMLCIIGGRASQSVAQAHPELCCVEFGVGYEGVFSDHRVFESYAWMHTVYGWSMGAAAANGRFYDAVIANSFDIADFPMGDGEGDHLLYMGRLTERKGLCIVADVAERTGLELVIAGEGDQSLIPPGATYMGNVGPKIRATLMGRARCVIAPSLFVEPFCGVAVEAQLCGTPVITTDWGAFTETVDHGRSGFRCRTLAEFAAGVTDATLLDRGEIRERAQRLYSTDNVRHEYADYFARLQTLRHDGWYTR